MNNLTTQYNISEINDNLYLNFKIDNNKYAINIKNVVEIMKLPLLDYPQKLPNNIVGLLNYNNFTVNVVDLRFYLNIAVTPYSTSNQLLIVNTDETIFGIIIDKVEDIFSLDQSQLEYLQCTGEDKIIECMYKNEAQNISMINLESLDNIIRQGKEQKDVDIPALFPKDDDSQYEFMQRKLILKNKFNTNLSTNVYAQDKFISFSLNENIWCINLEYVKEFLKGVKITQVPCKADYIAGVIFLKGDFVTIIDTRKLIGLKDYTKTSNIEITNNIIIVEIAEYKVGFLVDEIFNIINIPEETIKANSHNQEKFILSEVLIQEKLYSILNIKNILADEKFFIDES